ncbi:Cof-type HAD-IIB family hydrolase [uncultured Metabacillus sp.]|uniref:Cof-type HAD-IIB family hydrolase n=1 Tax=uncultured Metabacillus sp. TaxID=2860135 RepID=UPI00261B07AA|nr:Cof-type HAD-IIB family hydrolase [uncultured Metabacillus sp.]
MEYSILAVDLDGTLLNKEHEIDQESVEAIQEYRANGGKVVICSGRTALSTRWIAETIGITDPIVALNGAVIQSHSGNIIERFHFENRTLPGFIDFCLTHGAYAHFYEEDSILVPEENRWNDRWGEKNILSLQMTGGNPEVCQQYRDQCSVQVVTDFNHYFKKNPIISKIAVFHEEDSLYEFSKKLAEQSNDYEVSSSLNYANLEISPSGVSKAGSITRLAAQLGVPLSKVAAIGDNYNDMKLLKAAGLGIAMGNAPEKVKSAADVITDTNGEAGVAKAIRKFLL